MSKRLLSLILICLAAISWGTTGTAMVLMNQTLSMGTSINPWVVSFWRMALASPWLLIMAGRQPHFWRWPSRQTGLAHLGMGACIAMYQVCYFCAVPLAGVAVTALVAICSSPLLIALLAAWRLGERLTSRMYGSLFLGMIGTALLVVRPDAIATRPGFLLGVLLAFGSALAYASYAVIAKAQVVHVAPLTIAAYGFTTATLFLLPALVWQPPLADWLKVLPWLLYLGIVTTAIAYAIYMLGLRHISATASGIVVLLEPLTATLIGVFFFRESMPLMGVMGAILLLSAIALLTLQPKPA
ncbi:MAG: DMT family transporter [Cyanobacteria bacterium J06635_1]